MQRKFAVTLCALFCTLAAAAGNPKPFVIPELVSWEGGSGHFTLTPATVITHDEATTAVAERFAAECGELLGFTPKVVPARQNPDQIRRHLAERRPRKVRHGQRRRLCRLDRQEH